MQSLFFVFLGALGLLSLALLLVLAPLTWSLALFHLPMLAGFETSVFFWRVVIAVSVLSLALFAAHLWLPINRRKLSEVWPGILFTLLLWLASAWLFSVYLQNFSNYVATYAGLASVMIAIVFLYIVAVIFILGGELNAAIMRAKRLGEKFRY